MLSTWVDGGDEVKHATDGVGSPGQHEPERGEKTEQIHFASPEIRRGSKTYTSRVDHCTINISKIYNRIRISSTELLSGLSINAKMRTSQRK